MKPCLIALYLFVAPLLFCQQTSEKPQILISLNGSYENNHLLELLHFKFDKVEPLNKEKTLYGLYFKNTFENNEKALEFVSKLKHVLIAQYNFQVEMRSATPNDPRRGSQWHLDKINAPKAWDLTRGGVTRNGDSIVIAVIDEGIHINHPDFKNNIWKNHAEVANNSIDDDGNGFVDDVYGWNFMGRNNDVSDSNNYAAGHSTPIAGIIGAKGNDNVGICGINWNVKMMFVNIADTGDFPNPYVSDIIKAYSYVLTQRTLYNNSNGQQGAYVVATNSSWGIDKKFANQAPLWCAMYDSMGKQGIINIGSTSNNDAYIDLIGDLPSLCPSEHLIVVNSSNSIDAHFSSGKSAINIDIAAPGASIYSTRAYTKINIQNGLYGNSFSGTSFATPMVTGSVGLLYSYACAKLLDTFKINPAKGNSLLRRFLLEGADVIPGFEDKNASSGRLNIFRSMQLMNQYCEGTLSNDLVSLYPNSRVFPNPSQGSFELITENEIKNINITNSIGQKIEFNYLDNKIELINHQTGVYFVSIDYANGYKENIKLIVN